MPKQVYKITRFDGGLNSDSDPRDINDDELAGATDIDTTAIGRISMLGGFTDHESTSTAAADKADRGTGVAGTGAVGNETIDIPAWGFGTWGSGTWGN